MKIFITGGSGLLGSAISLYFKDYFEVTSTYTTHKTTIYGCKSAYLDITDAKATMNLIKKIKPEVILHTAALVGINICEKETSLAHSINVAGTKNIVDAAKSAKSKIVYISTDYVFDGKKGMYKENDKCNPINYYGKTKLEGEKLIDLKKDCIIRTSIYGWNVVPGKKSFSTWIIDELTNNKQINIFSDQFNSMMLTNNCAELLKEVVDKDLSGIINIASSSKISKYDFAVKLAEIFDLNKELINPVKNADVIGFEKRPLDVSLDITKSKKELKTKVLNISESISKLKEFKENGYLSKFKVV